MENTYPLLLRRQTLQCTLFPYTTLFRSLGMRYGLAMRRIVLPQAARVIIPPLGNEFNNMLKNTSLLFAIGVYEIDRKSTRLNSSHSQISYAVFCLKKKKLPECCP